ncbi:MAG: M48 family metallopeptidase, partial [Bacilli bacterium]|nr:M48 family metallopeptidase [Bacilli bacterium]
MERIKYDFSEFRKIMFALKTDQSSTRLNQLKTELNEFFKDSKCKDVIYTNNTDKLFFGMCVMPIVDGDTAVSILQSDKAERFNAYYLELDSRLFSPLLNLTSDELVAILLHEVGHIVNTPQPVEEVRNAVDIYLAKNKETLVISDSVHYREILAYGIKNSIRKLTSLFEYKDEEIIADEFVVMCGYGPQLESAYSKIIKNTGRINRDVSNKLIVLQWTLRLYKNVKFERISALK